MADNDRDQPRIAANRLAAAVVVGSLLVLLALGVLYRTSLLESLFPAHGPAVDSLPLYLMIAVVSVALVVWGWYRLLSLLG